MRLHGRKHVKHGGAGGECVDDGHDVSHFFGVVERGFDSVVRSNVM